MMRQKKEKPLEVQTADCLTVKPGDGGTYLSATRNRFAKLTRFTLGSPEDSLACVVSDAAVRAFAKGLVRLVGKGNE